MRMISRGWFALRWQVLERDKFTCRYCGHYAPNVQLEVDHLVPVVEGGTDDIDNLVTACFACNQGKEGLRVRRVWHTRGCQKNHRIVIPGEQRPTTADAILSLLGKSSKPMSPAEIAEKLSALDGTVRKALARLCKIGSVAKIGRRWICNDGKSDKPL